MLHRGRLYETRSLVILSETRRYGVQSKDLRLFFLPLWKNRAAIAARLIQIRCLQKAA
jgi:hypothetical protein